MNVAGHLYRLQEIELETESKEQALKQVIVRLGDNQVVLDARGKQAQSQQNLDGLKKQQHDLEWETDDLRSKIKTMESKLYSGRGNSKELMDLQKEVNVLKTNCSERETKALETMDQVEKATGELTAVTAEVKGVEAEWERQHQQLTEEKTQTETNIAGLKQQRQQILARLDAPTIALYEELKKKKGSAVARVEQGICRGCRISLPTADVVRARGGKLTFCSSCGRILYLP